MESSTVEKVWKIEVPPIKPTRVPFWFAFP
jgi:hypothetical protein